MMDEGSNPSKGVARNREKDDKNKGGEGGQKKAAASALYFAVNRLLYHNRGHLRVATHWASIAAVQINWQRT